MKRIIIKTIPFLFLIVLISCSETNTSKIERIFPEYSVVLDSVVAQPQGVVRGFELGDSKKNVLAFEGKKPESSDEKSIYFTYSIDSIHSYSIEYTFENEKLNEIEINIISRDKDLGSGILNDLKNYFTKKYTAPLMDNGIYVFNCFDSQKKNFIINLSDNSTSDCGKILLIIYRED